MPKPTDTPSRGASNNGAENTSVPASILPLETARPTEDGHVGLEQSRDRASAPRWCHGTHSRPDRRCPRRVLHGRRARRDSSRHRPQRHPSALPDHARTAQRHLRRLARTPDQRRALRRPARVRSPLRRAGTTARQVSPVASQRPHCPPSRPATRDLPASTRQSACALCRSALEHQALCTTTTTSATECATFMARILVDGSPSAKVRSTTPWDDREPRLHAAEEQRPRSVYLSSEDSDGMSRRSEAGPGLVFCRGRECHSHNL